MTERKPRKTRRDAIEYIMRAWAKAVVAEERVTIHPVPWEQWLLARAEALEDMLIGLGEFERCQESGGTIITRRAVELLEAARAEHARLYDEEADTPFALRLIEPTVKPKED